MEYQILPIGDLWKSGMFSVPQAIAEKYLKLASEYQLKALLIILSSAGISTDEEISKRLGITVSDVRSIMEFWEAEGVVCPSEEKSAASPKVEQVPAEAEQKREVKKSLPVKEKKQEIKISAPSLSPKDIACLAGENPEIAELLNEAQEAYGRTISPGEQEMIVNLVTFYGLGYGAVLMLLGYCRREREAGRAISAGYFYKIAERWLDEGITTVEEAEEKIRVLEQGGRLWQTIKERAQISKKAPTVSQMEMINQWKSDFSMEMIELAIDEMKENIDNPNLRYVDKILKNWKKAGIKTPAQYKKSLEEYKKKKEEAENAKSGKISRAPTYDLKDKRKKDLSNTDIKY